MATKMTKTTDNVENKEVVEKNTKRKYEANEPIECKSITNGELFMVGAKSKLLYQWADYDDVQEVEYQDLIYDVKSNSSFSKYPRFIILDEDFVNQNPQLEKIYESLYSISDLRNILDMSVSEMKRVIPDLPKGIKNTLKVIASTGINDGSFDSVTKIKVLDEILGTQMLQTLVND